MSTNLDIGTATPAQTPPARRRAGAFRRLLRKPLGVGSLTVLIVVVALGLLEPVLSAHEPGFSSLQHVNAPVGTESFLLGGDQNGRDIWARVLAAINVSVISGLIGAGVSIGVGTVCGLIAGYLGKRVDAVTSWVFNLLMTFPALVLVIVLQPVTGGSYQMMMVVFGFFLSPGIYRLVRNQVVGVRNELYVDAARVAGLSDRRILSRHVFYAVRGPVIVAAAFQGAAAIGVQAGLAFLGFGSTLTPSFGGMINDAFLNIYSFPLQFLWPSLFLALLNGSLILLGNAYRDVLAGPQATVRRRRRLGEAVPQPAASPSAASAPTRSGPTTGAGSSGATAAPAVSPVSASRAAQSHAGSAGEQGGLLSLRNLRVSYPQVDGSMREVVRGISLDIAPGEVVSLVGESGSGKTQTAFSVLGLLPKQAQVSADAMTLAGDSLLGKDAAAMRALRGGVVSYIPQEPMANLDPSFTIGSQLVEGLKGAMSRREAKATVLELLNRVGINDPVRTFGSYPHQISGGMAQRALIAGAVASRPRLLIADEPTTALDVTVQAEILDLLRDLQGEYGMGVLLVTHNFGIVADLAERVVVMRQGEVVETGPVRAIFKSPQHPYTQELIGSILSEETVRTDPPSSFRTPGPTATTDPVEARP